MIPELNEKVRDVARRTGSIYLEKYDLICSDRENSCFGITNDGFQSFYYDHVTLEGARFFGCRIAEIGWLSPVYDAMERSVSQQSHVEFHDY